jgi:PAS domain S-box-containing protein
MPTNQDHHLLLATRALLERTSRCTGDEFFRGLARGIAESLGMKLAFVGTLDVACARVRVKAAWNDGAFRPGFEYALDGTPCADVVDGTICLHRSGVQALFPRDAMLAELGLEAYLGLPITSTDGTPIGIIAALHDQPVEHLDPQVLTPILLLFAHRAAAELERIDAAARLSASEARYRQIVTTCQEGVWMLDAAGSTTFVNAPMAAMLGCTVEGMLGRHLFDFMDAEARREAEANLARRRQGVVERHDFRLRHADGSDVWTTMATNPLLDDEGHYVGALALCTDRTAARVQERKVQHAQKLESLGVLASGVAHDFNNLLVGILGNTDLALDALPSASPIRPMLEDVRAASTRAAAFTRQLLDYSGQGRFVVERLQLNDLVDELGRLLSSVLSKRAVLRFELDPRLPLVEGDVAQLQQILMNLLTNASDALDGQDGVITVSTRVVDADQLDASMTYLDGPLLAGAYVCLQVTDTGCGMSAATRDKIFDPFFTTKFTGRGLGLAAVLGILRSHRGAVAVASEPGEGTTFQVLLPSAGGAPLTASAVSVPGPAPAARAGTILVADDEAMIRKVTALVLEEAGFQVLLARDGQDAVDQFAAHADQIVAVLLDMTMPRLNGEEAFRQMRAVRPDVRVVLTSGYAEQEAMRRFAGTGLAGFLRKPWRADDLVDALRVALAPAR